MTAECCRKYERSITATWNTMFSTSGLPEEFPAFHLHLLHCWSPGSVPKRSKFCSYFFIQLSFQLYFSLLFFIVQSYSREFLKVFLRFSSVKAIPESLTVQCLFWASCRNRLLAPEQCTDLMSQHCFGVSGLARMKFWGNVLPLRLKSGSRADEKLHQAERERKLQPPCVPAMLCRLNHSYGSS